MPERKGPEWLVEQGIGETRAILVENGEVLAARLERPDTLVAGTVADAVLVSRAAGSARGTVRLGDGVQALVDGLDRSASEGASIRVLVTRSAIAEAGRFKLAHTRPSNGALTPAQTLAQRLRRDGMPVRTVSRFPDDPWPYIVTEALCGDVVFAGGSLLVSPTPAMTLIDIDGTLAPRALALAAVPAIAATIGRMDLGGSIGIDFPTLERKEDRRAVDEALAASLDHWPHQRTAMNGFGFVQLVARLERPSLPQMLRRDPAFGAALLLLRQAEFVAGPGRLLLTAHPRLRAAVTTELETELSRRTGQSIAWQQDSTLALWGGFAQSVPL